MKMLVVFTLLFAAAGCASKRPMLAPNEHFKVVGMATADRDIDECLRQAEKYVPPSTGRARKAGADTAALAEEKPPQDPAHAAASNIFRGFWNKPEPPAVQKNFVNRCLREKGYSPMGWE